jgi:hypothetical protein
MNPCCLFNQELLSNLLICHSERSEESGKETLSSNRIGFAVLDWSARTAAVSNP